MKKRIIDDIECPKCRGEDFKVIDTQKGLLQCDYCRNKWIDIHFVDLDTESTTQLKNMGLITVHAQEVPTKKAAFLIFFVIIFILGIFFYIAFFTLNAFSNFASPFPPSVSSSWETSNDNNIDDLGGIVVNGRATVYNTSSPVTISVPLINNSETKTYYLTKISVNLYDADGIMLGTCTKLPFIYLEPEDETEVTIQCIGLTLDDPSIVKTTEVPVIEFKES